MLRTYPDSARLGISPALARDLLREAEHLPLYDNKEFYDTALQTQIRDQIRAQCREGFDELVGKTTEGIGRWPYFVLIDGLSFDEGNRLFVALNRAFGELVALPYKKPRAQLVHYIQQVTDIRSPRGGWEVERLHTDATDWERPVDIISMQCIRPDPNGGGRSRMLDIDTIRTEVRNQLGEESLEILQTEPVPWQLSPACGGGFRWRTVFNVSGMCWRRYSIDLALNAKQATLSSEMLELLESFENVLESATLFDFLMREGQYLVSHNLRTIHARTPIKFPADSKRLMIRSWIKVSQMEN